MKKFILLGACICFSACANTSQLAEKADTAASDLYVAIAISLNSYENISGSNIVAAENLKMQAWQALATERQVYATAHTVDLSGLTAIASQVKTLTGH